MRILVDGQAKTYLFQKGILLSSKSLVELYNHLRAKYNISYLLTNRLNQDALEHFFGYMRAMGGANTNADPVEFKYRLRKHILGKHSAEIFTHKKKY